ncbi:MAG: hypothetical protein ACKO14_05830 [Armatimonadota bacterium]
MCANGIVDLVFFDQLAMNTETAYMQQVQQLRNKVTLRLTSQSMA